MKIAELLKEETITLKAGDYLASITAGAGYVPTHKDSDSIHTGRYLFKITEVDTTLQIIPIRTSDDGKSLEELTNTPIVIKDGNKVISSTGRNHPEYKDGYNGRTIHVAEDVETGQEDREVLVAFIEFVKSEYSMGVNDFMVAPPELIEGEVEEEEEEEEG